MSCVICNSAFHFGCVGYTDVSFRKMSKAYRASWKCLGCKSSRSGSPAAPTPGHDLASPSSIALIIDQLKGHISSAIKDELRPLREDINTKLNAVQTSIDSCLSKCNELSVDLAAVRADVDKVKILNMNERILSLEKNLSDLQASSVCPSPHQSDNLLQTTLVELEERRRRSANVLLFNVPEASSSNSQTARDEDMSYISALLGELAPDLVGSVRRAYRLGRTVSLKPRPLKVLLDSPASASRLHFRVRRERPSQISASFDQTPLQRQFLERTRAELRSRLEGGESNLTIKFVSGAPRVVPLGPPGGVSGSPTSSSRRSNRPSTSPKN